ncbi:hypothetical protein [Flavobacterium anhuiense]|uniref:hypothetical protein n=1 Tax=Flavobacterium anhuiense TaxID=459526 RepID=UPI000E6D3AE5|nr:hypothetical protein [Flavobacterium anhuiense]URM36317.1 hypothetical protein LLY39_18135 [Flavobacterium anhuiense]
MEDIDKSTVPFCWAEDKKFDWGEPYTVYHPIFKISPTSSVFSLEDSIIIIGENNLKKQLLTLYNVINNCEEFDRIMNYNEEEFDRIKILELIYFYIKENEGKLTPWEKYHLCMDELFCISLLEEKSNRKLHFVNWSE